MTRTSSWSARCAIARRRRSRFRRRSRAIACSRRCTRTMRGGRDAARGHGNRAVSRGRYCCRDRCPALGESGLRGLSGNREQGTGNRSPHRMRATPRPFGPPLGMTAMHGSPFPVPVPGQRFPVPRSGSRCTRCSGTGYAGRTGIYELFTVDEEIRRLVAERASLDALARRRQRRMA